MTRGRSAPPTDRIGERYDEDSLELLGAALERGALIRGASDQSLRSVLVVQ
jgi:hypothetical protein